MANNFTGDEWPYEAIQEHHRQASSDACPLLLMGEQEDIDAIYTILTQLGYLKRFGHPFALFYNKFILPRSYPDQPFIHPSHFKHQAFFVHPSRLPLLYKLLEQCPTLLYELTVNGETQRNYDRSDTSYFSDLEKALQERGWIKAAKHSPHYASIQAWQEAQKNPCLSYDPGRWWRKLSSLWKNFK